MMVIVRNQQIKRYCRFLIVVGLMSVLLAGTASSKPPTGLTVSITAPTYNSIVTGQVTVTAEAVGGARVIKMDFFIDGALLFVDNQPQWDGTGWNASAAWDTTVYEDGYHAISVRATDTAGKTALNRIDVVVKNSVTGNMPPVAGLHYSWNGNSYYFYPYDCYDPDGSVVKYQYTISKQTGDGTYTGVGSYACCEYASCSWPGGFPVPSLCEAAGEECKGPPQDSGFGLFYACPYIYYQFAEEAATYKVELTVWDNEGAQSNTSEGFITIVTSGSSNAMYVWGINPVIKSTGSGATLSLTATIRRDSNGNGRSDSNDFPVSGALVEMTLFKDTDDLPDGHFDTVDEGFNPSIAPVTTNRDGQATFVIRGLKPGDYRAQVRNLTHPEYQWNSALDMASLEEVTIRW